MTQKTCSVCHEVKDITEFQKDRRRKTGYASRCKVCHRAACKRYYQKNAEIYKARSKSKQWREENSEACRVQQKTCSVCHEIKKLSEFPSSGVNKDGLKTACKACTKIQRHAYYLVNKEKEAAQHKAYAIANKESLASKKRAYRLANKDRLAATEKAWHLANKEKAATQKRAYYLANAAETKARTKAWRKANPDAYNAARINRRARKAGNGGSFTGKEWADLKAGFDYQCLCCGAVEPEIQLTVDHVVPIASGGSSNIDNIQPLCLSCNCSKNAKTIDYRGAA
jgi:5-methylcytosine-specific restriction endonuclease McrA